MTAICVPYGSSVVFLQDNLRWKIRTKVIDYDSKK